MKKLILPIVLFASTAIVSHIIMVRAVPSVIMNIAMDKMAERGVPLNRFVASQRATPETQTIVRPSPDLAYAVCRFDFDVTKGAVQVGAQHWQKYASISFFDAQTNNFASIPVGDAGEEVVHTKVLLMPPGSAAIKSGGDGMRQIIAPSTKGLIIIRRLAPTDELYSAVQAMSGSDVCAPVSGGQT